MNKEVLQELCRVFGPTGRESRVAEIVRAHLEGLNLEVYADALGNVIARKGDGPYTVFCTHLDQPGWVVEHRDKKGFLHLKSVPADEKLGEGWAVDEGGNRYRVFKESDGKSWRAESLVEGEGEMGTFLVPKAEFEESKGAYFATALADRVGAALLLDIAGKANKGNQAVTLVCYTGRHLKFTGLTAALEDLDIERLYLIEALPCDEGNEGYSLGEGPVILLRTQHSVAPSLWVDEVAKIASDIGIKLQKGLVSDGESAADTLARTGIQAITLGMGVRYSGSRIERVEGSDCEALSKLLQGLAKGKVRS